MAQVVVTGWPLDTLNQYFIFTSLSQTLSQLNTALLAASTGNTLVIQNTTQTIVGVQISATDFVNIANAQYVITFNDLWAQNLTVSPYSVTFTK